jgi:hypothetical protein
MCHVVPNSFASEPVKATAIPVPAAVAFTAAPARRIGETFVNLFGQQVRLNRNTDGALSATTLPSLYRIVHVSSTQEVLRQRPQYES